MKKVIVNTKEFLAKLAIASSVISQKNTIPILETVHLKTQKSSVSGDIYLTVIASDSENWLTQRMGAVGDEGIDVCINMNSFLRGLRNVENDTIEIIEDNGKKSVTINYCTGYFKFAYESSNEYPMPQIDSFEEQSIHKIDAQKLAEYISKVEYASNNDTLRPLFNSVHFDFMRNGMVVVCTDGQRLAKIKNCDLPSYEDESFNLPIKTANILVNVVSSIQSEISCKFSTNNIVFDAENFQLTSRLIEGRYPNYDSVIPKDFKNNVIINKQQLISALKRVATMCSGTTELIKLDFSNEMLHINAEDIEFCTKGEETVQCNFKGEKMEIGFNASSLLQTVQNIDSEEISIKLIAYNRCAVLSPASDTGNIENVEYVYLLMPLLLN